MQHWIKHIKYAYHTHDQLAIFDTRFSTLKTFFLKNMLFRRQARELVFSQNRPENIMETLKVPRSFACKFCRE